MYIRSEKGKVSKTADRLDSQTKNLESRSIVGEEISDTTEKILSSPTKVLVAISSVVMFVIMLVVVADVSGRYFFKHPINGADEAEGLLLLCAAACGLSYTQREKGHVRIEVFTEHLSSRVRAALEIFNYIISLAMVSLITWQLFEGARKFIFNLQGGSSVSEVLRIPWYPFALILGLGFALYALVLIIDTIISITKAIAR